MKIKKKKLLVRALHALVSGCCLCLLSGTCSVVQQLEFPNHHLFWSVRWRRSCWSGTLLKSWWFSGSWVFSPSIIFSLISLKFMLTKNQSCPPIYFVFQLCSSFFWWIFIYFGIFFNFFIFQFHHFSFDFF